MEPSHATPRSRHHRFFAPCPRGLEHLLREELEAWSAKDVEATEGGVGFGGTWPLAYRVNLESRIASRVLVQVARARYQTEQDVYAAALRAPWRDWFSASRTIKVKVHGRRCALRSLDFVTLRIKDAVCDAFTRRTRTRPSVDTQHPGMRVFGFLDEAHCTLYLDTTGEPLFKRGWRVGRTEAPIRENLAAGLLKLAGWTSDHVLLDPMCGGGTILIEAAQMARRVAPGQGRAFAFQRLHGYDERAWTRVRDESDARQCLDAPLALYGSDVDEAAVRAARANCEAAGVAGSVMLSCENVLVRRPPAESGLILTNPPYGVRLGADEDLETFYRQFGDVLKAEYPGWRAHILAADRHMPKRIRLSPTRRVPVFNGNLDCRLYEFQLVKGGNRHTRRRAAPEPPLGGDGSSARADQPRL